MLGIPFLNLLFIYLCNETKKLHQYEMLKIYTCPADAILGEWHFGTGNPTAVGRGSGDKGQELK